MSVEECFWQIHANLDRQAPGSDETTSKLLAVASQDDQLHRALDVGCGPGRAALFLASSGLDVTAVDTHEPFLDELRQHAGATGLLPRLTIENVSMEHLPYPEASFDLIWAEGTTYIIGWQRALTEWKKLLSPAGKLVATDCHWFTDNRSAEAVAFWEDAYPGMPTIGQSIELAQGAGYNVTHTYLLPDSDWAEYYDPLEKKHEALMHETDADMREALKLSRAEVDIRRAYGDEYGYVGFVLSPVAE